MRAIIGRIFLLIKIIANRLIKDYQRTLFKRIGKNVRINNGSNFTYNTIEIGDDVSVGVRCVIQSAHGTIRIGSHVMIGPGVQIHGGDHVVDRPCVFMDTVHDKKDDEDGVLVIGDDVWIGGNAIILKGVTIGDGSVVAAGSIVTKDVPPCSIVAGIPARVIKKRFADQQIEDKHMKFLLEQKNQRNTT